MTEEIVRELVDFIPVLEKSSYQNAEVVVEVRDGEVYEVGGNWRQRREQIRTGKDKMTTTTQDLIAPWMQWLHNIGQGDQG